MSHCSESLAALFALKSERDLHRKGGKVLIDVIEHYLSPPSLEAANELGADWLYKIDGVPTNILGMACADLVKRVKGKKRREDGSPSILHEFSQIFYLTAFRSMGVHIERPDIVACISALHDLGEDYHFTPDEIRNFLEEWVQQFSRYSNFSPSDGMIEQLFQDIDIIVADFERMSRFIPGYKDKVGKKDNLRDILESPYASIAKAFDRIHNIATLVGAGKNKDIAKKIEETGLLMMTPIYRVPGVDEPMKYFDAAVHLHPENKEAYEFLSSLIGTALNMHIAHRVNKRERAKHGEAVLADTRIVVPKRLTEARLPRVLRPLRSLARRAAEFDSPHV